VEQVAFDVAVVDFFVEAAGLLGVPKSVAVIYGIVFASPEPLSFAAIETRLDISKGSISQGLRILREIGAVKEVSADTDRVELFTPDLELRKLIARFISSRLQTQLTAGQKRLAAIARQVPTTDLAHAELLRQRLKHLTGWHTKARALLPVARTFLKLSN
jgi:DNA-binding transcriptional regulator GbsR (MarR family)